MAATMTGWVDGKTIVLDWTSHTDGAVALGVASSISAYSNLTSADKASVIGRIVGVETIPGQNGDKSTSLPTNLYDLTLLDAYGADVIAGAGANRSGTVAEKVVTTTPIPVRGELTVTIAAAGSGKKGRIILTFE